MWLWVLSPLLQSVLQGNDCAQPAKNAPRGLRCFYPIMSHQKLDLKLKLQLGTSKAIYLAAADW